MAEILFIIITVLALILNYYNTGKNIKYLMISVLFLCFITILSLNHFFENINVFPPRILLAFIGGVSLVIYGIRTLEIKKQSVNFTFLIHALRVPVEIGLFMLYAEDKLPVTLTFSGWNFDILMGISALIFLVFARISNREPQKKLLFIWNIIGIIFLSFIVIIAILSSPLPFQQLSFENPNTAMLKFPIVFLPAYIVPIVYLTHFLSLKQLRQ